MICGVYKITNITNGDFYIGSSINIEKRKYVHFYQLDKNIHHNKYFQRAYNKYKKDNFIFELVEECEENELLVREQYHIDSLSPIYNNLRFAGNSKGYKHSKEAVEKMKNISRAYCSKKLYQYDINHKLIKEWNSCAEFTRYYNISRPAIAKALKKGHKCRGFIVSYNSPTL